MVINVILALMVIASFLLAIPLHECSHALVASWLGDSSPRREGRQSLSLRPHLDPVGTLMCVVLAFQPLLAVGLGWGKPVKPDTRTMHVSGNTGALLVALAGPLLNLIVGILFAVLVRFLPAVLFTPPFLVRIPQILTVFASVNICLTLLNILPIYPLDGYDILYALLPDRQAYQFARSQQFGPLIILALFFLLPFLAQFSGLSSFFLFQLPYYFWLGSMNIISLVTGHIPDPFNIIRLYLF